MKLKIVSAYTKSELAEHFNNSITSDMNIFKIETHIEEGPKTSYSIFIFYEEEPVYKKEGDGFIDELTSLKKEDNIEEHLENNYAFFKTINNFLKK